MTKALEWIRKSKGIGEAMELDGKRLDWKIKSGSALEVSVEDE